MNEFVVYGILTFNTSGFLNMYVELSLLHNSIRQHKKNYNIF